eukprot:3810495-Rhodomonas_salina.3
MRSAGRHLARLHRIRVRQGPQRTPPPRTERACASVVCYFDVQTQGAPSDALHNHALFGREGVRMERQRAVEQRVASARAWVERRLCVRRSVLW